VKWGWSKNTIEIIVDPSLEIKDLIHESQSVGIGKIIEHGELLITISSIACGSSGEQLLDEDGNAFAIPLGNYCNINTKSMENKMQDLLHYDPKSTLDTAKNDDGMKNRNITLSLIYNIGVLEILEGKYALKVWWQL